MLGMAETNDEYVPVRLKVENKTWKLLKYDILTSIDKKGIKKEDAASKAPGITAKPDSESSSSKLSIAQILEMVKNVDMISNVLSKDAAAHLGYERGIDHTLGKSLLYSLKTDTQSQQQREALDSVREDADLYAQVKQDENALAALQMLMKLMAELRKIYQAMESENYNPGEIMQ